MSMFLVSYIPYNYEYFKSLASFSTIYSQNVLLLGNLDDLLAKDIVNIYVVVQFLFWFEIFKPV